MEQPSKVSKGSQAGREEPKEPIIPAKYLTPFAYPLCYASSDANSDSEASVLSDCCSKTEALSGFTFPSDEDRDDDYNENNAANSASYPLRPPPVFSDYIQTSAETTDDENWYYCGKKSSPPGNALPNNQVRKEPMGSEAVTSSTVPSFPLPSPDSGSRVTPLSNQSSSILISLPLSSDQTVDEGSEINFCPSDSNRPPLVGQSSEVSTNISVSNFGDNEEGDNNENAYSEDPFGSSSEDDLDSTILYKFKGPTSGSDSCLNRAEDHDADNSLMNNSEFTVSLESVLTVVPFLQKKNATRESRSSTPRELQSMGISRESPQSTTSSVPHGQGDNFCMTPQDSVSSVGETSLQSWDSHLEVDHTIEQMVEMVSRDLTIGEHEIPKNHILYQRNNSIASDRKTSPVSLSSHASSRRLEWDNGADIGYLTPPGQQESNNTSSLRSRLSKEGIHSVSALDTSVWKENVFCRNSMFLKGTSVSAVDVEFKKSDVTVQTDFRGTKDAEVQVYNVDGEESESEISYSDKLTSGSIKPDTCIGHENVKQLQNFFPIKDIPESAFIGNGLPVVKISTSTHESKGLDSDSVQLFTKTSNLSKSLASAGVPIYTSASLSSSLSYFQPANLLTSSFPVYISLTKPQDVPLDLSKKSQKAFQELFGSKICTVAESKFSSETFTRKRCNSDHHSSLDYATSLNYDDSSNAVSPSCSESEKLALRGGGLPTRLEKLETRQSKGLLETIQNSRPRLQPPRSVADIKPTFDILSTESKASGDFSPSRLNTWLNNGFPSIPSVSPLLEGQLPQIRSAESLMVPGHARYRTLAASGTSQTLPRNLPPLSCPVTRTSTTAVQNQKTLLNNMKKIISDKWDQEKSNKFEILSLAPRLPFKERTSARKQQPVEFPGEDEEDKGLEGITYELTGALSLNGKDGLQKSSRSDISKLVQERGSLIDNQDRKSKKETSFQRSSMSSSKDFGENTLQSLESLSSKVGHGSKNIKHHHHHHHHNTGSLKMGKSTADSDSSSTNTIRRLTVKQSPRHHSSHKSSFKETTETSEDVETSSPQTVSPLDVRSELTEVARRELEKLRVLVDKQKQSYLRRLQKEVERLERLESLLLPAPKSSGKLLLPSGVKDKQNRPPTSNNTNTSMSSSTLQERPTIRKKIVVSASGKKIVSSGISSTGSAQGAVLNTSEPDHSNNTNATLASDSVPPVSDADEHVQGNERIFVSVGMSPQRKKRMSPNKKKKLQKRKSPTGARTCVKVPSSVSWFVPFGRNIRSASSARSKSGDEKEDPKSVNLQEAFKTKCEHLIQRSQSRLLKVAKLAEMRYRRMKASQLSSAQSKYSTWSRPPRKKTEGNARPRKTLTHKQMRHQTEKMYRKLPEVVEFKKKIYREEQYKTNRLMARMYNKGLQEQALRGRVTFPINEASWNV